MRTRFFALGTLLATLLVTACQQSSEPVGPLLLKNPPHTAVSLAPGVAELATVAGLRVIGRTASDDFPPSLKAVPVVATVKPDFEKIAALKPDIVLYDKDLYSESDLAKLAELKIPTFGLGGDTVAAFEKELYRFGAATSSESTMSDNVQRIIKAENIALGDKFPSVPKVALLMLSPNSNPMISGVKSFYSDLVRSSGGNPIGPDSKKFESISGEALLALNPDVILVAQDTPDPNKAMSDPALANLPCVKAGRVISIDSGFVLRRGSRAADAIEHIHSGLAQVLRK